MADHWLFQAPIVIVLIDNHKCQDCDDYDATLLSVGRNIHALAMTLMICSEIGFIDVTAQARGSTPQHIRARNRHIDPQQAKLSGIALANHGCTHHSAKLMV